MLLSKFQNLLETETTTSWASCFSFSIFLDLQMWMLFPSLLEAKGRGWKVTINENQRTTYCTAIDQGADVGVVIVGHLLVVGAQETDGLVVIVLVLVVPGHRLVAVVGHVLPAGCAQQPQERHLDHADGITFCIHIGKLRRRSVDMSSVTNLC